jgi:ABC-2 type transport system permease protein
LSRPLTRLEYVFGKALVLIALLSSITWIPGLLLYLLNSAIAEDGWGISHFRIAGALVTGGLAWIVVITLLVLSLSTWIRWHLAASSTLFGIYFVSAGFGEAVTVVLRVTWGRVFSFGHEFEVLWAALFGTPLQDRGVTPLAAGLALSTLCAFSIIVIHRQLRAREVVR